AGAVADAELALVPTGIYTRLLSQAGAGAENRIVPQARASRIAVAGARKRDVTGGVYLHAVAELQAGAGEVATIGANLDALTRAGERAELIRHRIGAEIAATGRLVHDRRRRRSRGR